MYVSVGYSENPDTSAAGAQAAMDALRNAENAGRNRPCDLVMLFATVRHDAKLLRTAVVSVLGNVPLVGGGAIGAISHEHFGYAGNQLILAAFWLEGIRCEILTETCPAGSEEEAGRRLGQRLASAGSRADSHVLLFYDAIDRSHGDLRMAMATPLLRGMEQGMGALPDMIGAGLMGDYNCSATWQWTGSGLEQHTALALAFFGDMRIDSAVMHGCRPATGYYTITRADGPVILEINGQPALPFMHTLLGGLIQPEEYGFFLIFGVNSKDKWAPFDETSYASRLCLGVDKERNGIVMFEPDMTEGVEFQIMYRSLGLDYMPPKVAGLFERLRDRRPVFATYINCAGRAAAYAGLELDDARLIQQAITGRVPLLGLYTGVEIAPVGGRPRGLDWTGVLSVFSVPL